VHATTRMDFPRILANVESYRKCIASAYKRNSNTRKYSQLTRNPYSHPIASASHIFLCPQNMYYSGILKPPTRLENIKVLAQDSFILVSTTLALYRLCNGSATDKDLTSGLNSSLWVYPSLPVAIFGLSVVIFSHTKVKLWLIFVITILFTLFVIAMVSVILALTLKRQGHPDLWEFSTFPILYETIPLWALSHNLIFGTGFLSILIRFGLIIASAVTHHGYFPFCQLRGWGFGGTLTALAIINMILALYAIWLAPRRERPAEIEEMEEIP